MGISVPLKLKDSAGLQSIDSDNYDFLAYRAGLQLVGLDSNAVAGYGIRDANTDKRDIGDIINTFYDSATGTHGPDALFSTTSITTNLYQGTGTLEYTDSNYRNFVYQTDSANDSGSQKILQAFTDDDWTNLNNNIVSRMVKKDYPGVIYLGDSDFDSANGSWSKLISNFYSDTRTSGDAVNYHIWQKQYLTDSAPADSAKPFTMKYRADSAEVNVAGAFKDIGRDSDFPNSKGRYYPSSTGVLSNASLNRVAMAFTSLNSQQEFDSNSSLYLSLDKEWSDKIVGVWQRTNGPAGRGTNVSGRTPSSLVNEVFSLKHYQQTQFSTVPNNSAYVNKRINDNSLTHHVYKDSANDTLPNRLGSRPQVWLGVKGRVDLVDSARFGSSAATFAATDATMQSYVESDGKWSFHFNFDSGATFSPKRVVGTTGTSPNGISSGLTYIYDSEGVANLATAANNDGPTGEGDDQFADVAVSRPGYNYWHFPSPFATNKATIIPDSSTTAIIKQARSNGYFANLLSSIPTSSSFKGIGYDSADEISLIFKNDFLGFQLADSDQLDETLNKRVRNYLADTTSATNPPIGTYLLRSSGDGTPSQSGILGTWEPKGVATDFRNQIIDVNYTRTSTTVFDRIRSSSFSAVFSADYTGERTSNFTDGFLGNYLGNYTRERDTDYDRTRTSSYEGQYVGNYTGNYTGEITANAISTVGSGSYPRTIIQTGGVPAGNYTGDGGTGYLGTGSTETARTIVVAETTVTNGTLGTFSGSYVVQTNQQYGTYGVGSGFSGSFSKDGVTYTITSHGFGYTQSFTTSPTAPSGTSVSIVYAGGGYTQSATSNGSSWSISGSGSPPYSGSPGTYTLGWTVKGDSTTYSITSQTAGTGWSNNAATIDASDGTVSSPAQTKSFDFSRDYDGNYDGNYSTDYEGNYTGDFLGNYEGEFQRITTADYTGDFIGNYDGEYSTDYEGNYEGAYETDYVGNYDGNFTGNYTATHTSTESGGRPQGWLSNSVGSPDGHLYLKYSQEVSLSPYPGGSPDYAGGLTANYLYYEIMANPNVGDFGITYDDITRSSGANSNSSINDSQLLIKVSFGSAPIDYVLPEGTRFILTWIQGGTTKKIDATVTDGDDIRLSTTQYGYGLHKLTYDNCDMTITGGTAETWDIDYGTTVDFQVIIDGADYTRVSTRNSTRTSTGTYVGIYDRTRTSLYEGTYTRERDENFQSGDAYSSVYSAVYTGNYEGNYTSDYTGNYEGNYTGDFVGTTIGTDKSGDAYETFTLYVRTD